MQRDPSTSFIKVDIDASAGSITITNDGKGIPVVRHEKEGIYVPELVCRSLDYVRVHVCVLSLVSFGYQRPDGE